jgi:hypothetical protein
LAIPLGPPILSYRRCALRLLFAGRRTIATGLALFIATPYILLAGFVAWIVRNQ